MRVPASAVPLHAAQIITAVQDLAHGDATELRDCQECGVFHFYRQTPLSTTLGDFVACFAVEGIGCPCCTRDIGDAMCVEDSCDGSRCPRLRVNPPIRGDIMIRGALVAECFGGDHDMPQRQFLVQ